MTDIVAITSATIAVIAALFAALQIIVTRRLSRADLISQAMAEYFSQASRTQRQAFWKLKNESYEQWSDSDIEVADKVATQLSYLGLLIKHGYGSGDAFLSFYGSSCVQAFTVLAPLVAQRRAEYDAADQWIYLEWLARTCAKFGESDPWWQKESWKKLVRETPTVAIPQ